MKQVTPAGDANSDVALDHLVLHVGWGLVLGTLLIGSFAIVTAIHDGLDWSDVRRLDRIIEGSPYVMVVGAAAAVVGLLRLDALRWLGRRAGRQRWPVAGLLLASAGLFALPLLPVFLLLLWLPGEAGRDVAHVTLVICAPFLVSYVAATYRLRQRLTAPGRR